MNSFLLEKFSLCALKSCDYFLKHKDVLLRLYERSSLMAVVINTNVDALKIQSLFNSSTNKMSSGDIFSSVEISLMKSAFPSKSYLVPTISVRIPLSL